MPCAAPALEWVGLPHPVMASKTMVDFIRQYVIQWHDLSSQPLFYLFTSFKEGVHHYAALLLRSVEAVEVEFQTWHIGLLCRGMTDPPFDCMSSLNLCDKTFYSANHSLLSSESHK